MYQRSGKQSILNQMATRVCDRSREERVVQGQLEHTARHWFTLLTIVDAGSGWRRKLGL